MMMATTVGPLIWLVLSIRMPWFEALITPRSIIPPVMVLPPTTAMPVGPGEIVPLLFNVPENDVLLTVTQAVAPELV